MLRYKRLKLHLQMQQPYILFCLRAHCAAALSRLSDRDEPQMLIQRDKCCQNNCCFTGKLSEFTQYLCINVMRVAEAVDTE